jgi:hypothetical protein
MPLPDRTPMGWRWRRRPQRRLLGALALAAVLAVPVVVAQTGAAAAPAPPSPMSASDWKSAIHAVARPGHGCFTATYPSMAWQGVACRTAPSTPMPPNVGPRPQVIGNGSDVAAQVTTGLISSALGSFDQVNVTSESGPIGNAGPSFADTYTLQLNTNFFSTPTCSGSSDPSCKGWLQFVFENNPFGAMAFMQSWLIGFTGTCPAGWMSFSMSGVATGFCFRNSLAVPVASQPIINLASLQLGGAAIGIVGLDQLSMFTSTTSFSVSDADLVGAAGGWNTAEFGVFGDGGNATGGGTATFNPGASLLARVQVQNGTQNKPLCLATGFTGEKNSLHFGEPRPTNSGPGPALRFQQNSAPKTIANCAAAIGVGDPHLTTFDGLAYDFQATGDFVSSRMPDFEVQTRHVSGAPRWPYADVNQAVATRMGKTQVAVCPGDNPLFVDGKPAKIADGGILSLPTGVQIDRTVDTYRVTDAAGDSMRAIIQDGYIDVEVGPGTWPVTAQGLLANPDHNPHALQAANGTTLTVPFSFADLYKVFGDSWRVNPKASLLTPCGKEPTRGNPSQPFTIDNLNPDDRGRATQICEQAGVKDGPLLTNCILDVAVLGPDAANAWVDAELPVVVGTVK